jgi:hypothetical protein
MAVQTTTRSTFHKIVDGSTLSFTLQASQGTQIKSKDPTSYYPNFTTTPQIITPTLVLAGSDGSNQIKGTCTWYIDDVKVTATTTRIIETSGEYRFQLKENLTKASTVIKCEYLFTHPVTGLTMKVTAQLPLAQVENAGTMIMAKITSPDTIFNTVAGVAETLTFNGTMVRGGAPDTTNVSYQWYILGTNGTYYAITSTKAPTDSGLPAGDLFTGAGTATLTVSSNAVLGTSSIKLVCKDTDSSSSTYNKTCEDVIGVLDATDPYDMKMQQPGGSGIPDGSGVPMLFEVYQGGTKWTDAQLLNKKIGFYRLTAALAKDTTWAPAASDFTGWTVASGDVSRTFNSTNGLATDANRTVTIKYEHLLAGVNTTFEGYLDF